MNALTKTGDQKNEELRNELQNALLKKSEIEALLNGKIEKLEDKIQDLAVGDNNLIGTKELKNLKSELSGLKEKVPQSLADSRKHSLKNQKYNEGDLVEKIKHEKDLMENNLKNENKNMEMLIDSLKKENNELMQNIKEKHPDLYHLKKNLENIKEEKENLEKKLNMEKNDHKHEIEAYKREKNNLIDTLKDKNPDLYNLKKEIEALKKDKELLQKKIREDRNLKSPRKSTVIYDSKESLDKSKDGTIEDKEKHQLKTIIKDLKEKLKFAEDKQDPEYHNMKNKMNSLENDKKKLMDNYKKLRHRLETNSKKSLLPPKVSTLDISEDFSTHKKTGKNFDFFFSNFYVKMTIYTALNQMMIKKIK